MSNPLSPPQRNPNRWSASMAGTNDVRGALHRRFTTNTVPTLSPIGQQRRQAAGDVQQQVSRQRYLRGCGREAGNGTEPKKSCDAGWCERPSNFGCGWAGSAFQRLGYSVFGSTVNLVENNTLVPAGETQIHTHQLARETRSWICANTYCSPMPKTGSLQ